MKSINTAAAATAAILLAAPFAQAQSNVTISGIIDGCVAVAHGTTGTSTQINSGCAYGSRLIFRGQEDLGNGMKADFSLESGFNIDSGALGQGGRLFGRKALVGLTTNYGALHLGRDYAPAFYLIRPVDPFKLGMGTAGSMISTSARPDGSARNDNAVVYTSPTVNGFSVKAQYAAGETGTVNEHARDSKGILLLYSKGPAFGGIVYNTHANATDSGNDRTLTIGGSYKFLAVEPAFLYQIGKWEGSRTVAVPAVANSLYSRDYNSMLLGVTVQPGGKGGRYIVSYKRYDDKTVRNFDASQITVGYKYSLSKRTELYAAYSRVDNKNKAAYSVSDATTTYGPVDPDSKPSTLFAGITHNF